MDLKDWLKSINETKDNLIDEDPLLESKYLPYIVNRCMSGHIDALMYANEMNINSHLDKKLQYDFFLNSLRSKKRFSPWMRKEELSNLQTVKKYYGYSDEKARQVLPLLSDEQLDIIRQRLDTGGLK
jgi:hypothetical protein|tara:strand:- start:479 stop:859 length:381 start_codon:yes stop_codon:yes gene_type:complete